MYIFNHENKPVHIKTILLGGDGFVARYQPIQDGKRYEVIISTSAALAPGVHKQTLKILTDSKETPELQVYVEATVIGSVITTPTSILLPAMAADIDPATISLPPIYVRKIRATSLQIKTVHSSLPFLRLNLASEQEGKSYKIDITFQKDFKPVKGEFKGIIRIETNDPDALVIEVPVQGSFK